MKFSAAILPLAFSLAAAQYNYGSSGDSSSSSASTATSSAAPVTFTSTSGKVTHKVAVGKNGLSFTPNSFNASVGDNVEFHFYPKTHSVASASFAAPCAPVNDTAFFSGPMTTTGSVNDTTYTITINNTSPIWLYCGYPMHCQMGMVAVINPPASTSKTLELFAKAAAETKNTTVPPHVQGGIKGAAASTQSGSGSGTPSSTGTAAGASGTGNAASTISAGITGGLLSLVFAAFML